MTVLDVGCGLAPEGDVNTDIQKRRVPNFVQCDVYHLPFRDKAFTHVVMNHVLEHLHNPLVALKELKRVCHNVHVSVPNSRYYRLCQLSPDHIWGWSSFELENLLNIVFRNVHVNGSIRLMRRSKMGTVKAYLLMLFLRERNELTAVCN